MSSLVTSETIRDVAVITVDNPPVNALSPEVQTKLEALVDAALAAPAIRGLVLAGANNTFIAGVDIKELQKLAQRKPTLLKELHPLLNRLEASTKPVVCALSGVTLGGGLELALACHYRMASPSARVGLPEVKLGLIPGAGGTQRLPRLIGLVAAAELCATGQQIDATAAQQAGLVDELVTGELRAAAIDQALKMAASGQPPRQTSATQDRLGTLAEHTEALSKLRARMARQGRGASAPLKAIEAVEASATLSFPDGLRREADLFRACLQSSESAASMHVFFGERTVAKIPGLPQETQTYTLRQAAVIGAGTMGGGIVMTCLDAGIPVVLKEIDSARLERGLDVIRRNYAEAVKKGRLTDGQMQQRLALLEPTTSYEQIGKAEIVIEAVFENMALKKQVFREIDAAAAPDAILASNTSTLDIDALAAETRRPERVIGNHFFSPANLMRLLEIVRGRKTSHEVIATCMALARRLRKIGVLVGNCHGFVGNRMFGPFLREAQYLAEEGASITEIDETLVQFGMAMGVFTVEDLAGIDVGWRVRQENPHWLPEGYRKYRAADRLAEMGRHGQKTGAGWYRYEPGRRTPIPDPRVEEIIAQCATAGGIVRRKVPPQEILDRMMYALVNEGARILEDGIALRAVDIDIIYVNGYGFPAHRGGPMFYADTLGLPKVLERIQEFERQHGFWWKPAPLLEQLAKAGRKFCDMEAKHG